MGLVERRLAASSGEPCRCIPWEEILCVALGDWEALGFESVARYLYVDGIQKIGLGVGQAVVLAIR